MLVHHLILAILWILYGVLHSVLASVGVKNKLMQRLGKGARHYRLGYTGLAFVLFALVLWYQLSIPTIHLYQPSFLIVLAGYLVTIFGVGIMLACIKKYFISLSGLRSLFQPTSRPTLMVSGIHRHVRHPLYLGTFLTIWGLAILFPYLSLIIANTVITLYTVVAIRFEEEKLVQEFGDDYRAYQRSVPKLWPKW